MLNVSWNCLHTDINTTKKTKQKKVFRVTTDIVATNECQARTCTESAVKKWLTPFSWVHLITNEQDLSTNTTAIQKPGPFLKVYPTDLLSQFLTLIVFRWISSWIYIMFLLRQCNEIMCWLVFLLF